MTTSTQFHNPPFNISRQGFNMISASAVQAEIKTFATKANHLADQILCQEEPKSYTGPVIIHSHHYYQPWPMFWYNPGPRYVVIDNRTSCPGDRKKDDQVAALLIGIISAAVAGVALYSLGSSIAAYNDASQELADTQDFQEKLNFSPRNSGEKEQEKIDEAYQISNLKGRICNRIKSSAANDIVLKASLCSAAGASLAGAIVTAPALITAGVVAGLISTGGLLFKWGFDSTDNCNRRDAQALKASISHLKSL